MASIEKLPMLAEGYERLTAELRALREERPRIVEAIEEARAHGDLSENAEYHAAKERQGQVEASISDLEDRVSRAQIVDPTNGRLVGSVVANCSFTSESAANGFSLFGFGTASNAYAASALGQANRAAMNSATTQIVQRLESAYP